MNDFTLNLLRTRVQFPPPPPYKEIMFRNWFKKKEKLPQNLFLERETQDEIEESLWEIKEEYDLPTEEVLNVVHSKRKNLDHMHQMISKKEKYE